MDLKMRKMKNMESKQTPLTLVEAEHEFGKVARAFGTYVEKTKHLGQNAVLVAEIGEHGFARSQDPELPWIPCLYAAANLMSRDDCTPSEIKETFDSFIKDVIMKQAAGHVPPSPAHPLERLRAIMVATINELMPVLRRMHEFPEIVARAGSEDELKMQLVRAFNHALLGVITEAAQTARQ